MTLNSDNAQKRIHIKHLDQANKTRLLLYGPMAG